MCFAPRYISGTMARPSSPCRNTASLPATPCASTTAPETPPTSAATAPTASKRYMASGLNGTGLLALIAFMAGITGLVDDFSDSKNPLRVLLRRRGHCRIRRIPQRMGELHPVAAIDGAG